MKYTIPRIPEAQWSSKTSVIPKKESFINIKESHASESCLRSARELHVLHIMHNYQRYVGWLADSWEYCFLKQYRNTKFVNSDPCLGVHNSKSTGSCVIESEYNRDSTNHMKKIETNIHLQNVPPSLKQFTTLKCPYLINDYSTSNLQRIDVNGTSMLVILPEMKYSKYNNLLQDPSLEQKSSPIDQITKEQNPKISPISKNATAIEHFGDIYLERVLTWNEGHRNFQRSTENYRYDSSIRHELASEILKSCVSIKSITTERLISSCIVEPANDRNMQLRRYLSFTTLEVVIRPYAQTYLVYNVMEQSNAQMKEQGTSQQFKQRSQGIGSGSVSGNDSSTSPPKRRTIKIESGCSFSVEFIDRGKSTGSETSSPEPVTDTTSKGKGKKDLHRCLCTLSFPTDDKKLKKKPCDSGVCVPGKCTPSECFRRLQEKYGSKKSASDISSSQASQTSKKKEREGKETLLKEKGSSSISKYKESVEVKPLPEKEKEKFNFVTVITKCCKQLQFWKKDKQIDLKPAVIGTDISVKDDKEKTFGSNAATQSGKKKGEKKTTAKKGKKVTENTEEKKGEKKKEKKGEKKEKKKAEKIEEKKKGSKKASKKVTKEEVKTETKATGVKTKKGRPLQPYECEPGVCTPKVCIPKECYERKFPPAPPKQGPPPSKFMICLRKLCCRKTGVETGGVSAATQARKSTTPDMPPGTTVYKEVGSSVPKTAKQRGDTGLQQPIEGGDVSMDTRKTKKQTAYSGIQYYQTIDSDTMMQRQGLNIGSECGCSVEFYKTMY